MTRTLIAVLIGLLWMGYPIGCTTPTRRVSHPSGSSARSGTPDTHVIVPGTELRRTGDEIVVCGRLFHTGTPVVLWTDPGGYDAYRTEKRFAPIEKSAWKPGEGPDSPNRYGLRAGGLSKAELARVRGGAWDLPTLAKHIDQFVIHYDAAGSSRQCFAILHDKRGLSVHFMIDLDGTIYQTLDLKERAWHATVSNDRSIGVEMANIGAYPIGDTTLDQWYSRDAQGPRVRFPAWLKNPGIRTAGFIARPARTRPVVGVVQGQRLEQYDFTDAQYDALIKLTATLCKIFPRIACDYPRDAQGRPITHALSPDALAAFHGVLGHDHIQTNKIDPGPAFDWDRVIDGARVFTQ